MIASLAAASDLGETLLTTFLAVFVRVSAAVALLPGLGSPMVPMRIRLAVAMALSALVAPMVPELLVPTGGGLVTLIAIEATNGVALGLVVRCLLMALQFAGSIAAQSMALLQIFGPAATPDPMPAIGTLLTLAGVTLAFVLGLHLRLIEALIESYRVLPPGVLPVAGDVADWGVSRGAAAISLAVSLAAPFLLFSVLYNLTLGVINRAMPQLMVVLVGAPAIAGAGLVILMLSAPLLLARWHDALADLLAAPYGR